MQLIALQCHAKYAKEAILWTTKSWYLSCHSSQGHHRWSSGAQNYHFSTLQNVEKKQSKPTNLEWNVFPMLQNGGPQNFQDMKVPDLENGEM
jgi:hypothetical protein